MGLANNSLADSFIRCSLNDLRPRSKNCCTVNILAERELAAALPLIGPPRGQKCFEFFGERRFESEVLVGARVFKSKHRRVQRKALVRPAAVARGIDGIALVAQNGVPGLGEVHANLVSPPGFEGHADVGRVAQSLRDTVMSDRPLAGAARSDRIPLQASGSAQSAVERS